MKKTNKQKILKRLIRFHSANKIDNYNKGWGERKEKIQKNLSVQFSSVQFSRSVVSDSLRSRELQYTRPPRPSSTPSSLRLTSIESMMPSSHLKRIYRTSQIIRIMFFLSHCCQNPFPHWESECTSPP